MSTQKKKSNITVHSGHVHIQATFNNTIISLTKESGDVLLQESGGSAKFTGARRATAFAAQSAAEILAQKAMDNFGMKKVKVFVKGPGPGRDSAFRALKGAGLQVLELVDKTGVAHNGCRPRKKRRI